MKTPFNLPTGLATAAASLCVAASLTAQTLNFQTAFPTPGPNDIYNFIGSGNDSGNVNDGLAVYPDGAANDGFTYVANNRAGMGQTFTTGGNSGGYVVRAIWMRSAGYTNDTVDTYWSFGANSAETFRITVPSQVGTAGFALETETYTITGLEPGNPGGFNFSTNGSSVWMRFGFANTNIMLQPNTQYGLDVTGIGGDFWETWGTSNDVYSGGAAYIGSTDGAVDDTMNIELGDRAFMVEMAGQNVAPTNVSEPSSTMVYLGNTANFTASFGGTLPLSYQWYRNSTNLLSGQTNATLVLYNVATNQIGGYSVVVTNAGGAATSSVAKLSVILPVVTTNVGFNAPGGGILDLNTVGIGLPTRLAGTGAAIGSGGDGNLELVTNGGYLEIYSPDCDFNGQVNMDVAEAVGFNLSSLGFSGAQDFVVNGFLTNSVVGANYDQAGLFVGTASSNLVRGGIIFNSNFAADPGGYGVGNQNGGDIGIATSLAPVGEMDVTISRAGGVWAVYVNGLNVTPLASLTYMNSAPDMTAGVFALNTSGDSTDTSVNAITASLFNGPKLNMVNSGGHLTFTWNVVGSGLETNSNLSNPSGWAPVAGSSTSPYMISTPTSGTLFYRIAP